MNKKEFIKQLREKLSILDDNEIKDIIVEYTDIIDEKIKNGEKEEDAIKDFGDINELAKEILKAYKINPEKIEKNDETDLGKDFETFIKKGANKLSDFTKDVVSNIKENDNNFTLEGIFEIVLKAIALLFICAILRLPFMLITGFGEAILNIPFFPIDTILIFCWNVIIWIVYVIVCILIGIAMFKGNIKSNSMVAPKVEPKKSTKKSSSVKEESGNKKEEKKETKNETVKVENVKVNNEHPAINAVLLVIKILVTIFITVPIIFINIGIGIALCILIYYLFVGINLLGPIFILIGIMIFFCFLSSVFINMFNNKIKHVLLPIIFSFIFVIVGSLITFEQVRHYEYYDDVSSNLFTLKTTEKTLEFDNMNKRIEFDIYFHDEVNKTIDNEYPDGKLLVVVEHYSDELNINYNVDEREYEVNISRYMNRKGFWKIYDDIINNLKDKKVYSYDNLDRVKINIIGNEKTLNLISYE